MGKILSFGILLVLAAGCGIGSTHPATPLHSPTKPSSKATTKGWVPALADVKQVTLTLGADPLLNLQTTGPIHIYPASPKGKALIKKLLHLLAGGKEVPMSPVGGPAFGAPVLTFDLRDGNTLDVSQSFATQEASPSVLDESLAVPRVRSPERKYEDPALARWLVYGWSQDTQAIAEGWACTSKRPPNGHPNQISGTLPGGQAWLFVGSSQGGCVTFYTRNDGAWTSSIVTEDGPMGAAVERAQFVDATHGFVLVGGNPGAGQLPRVLYETSDGGATWHALPNSAPFPMSDTNVQMRFMSPTDGWMTTVSQVYSPTRVYVYHTTNGGQSWTGTYFTLPPALDQYASDYTVATLYYAAPGKLNDTIAVFGQWTGIAWFDTSDDGLNWKYDPLGNG